jgi:hypothetical protein
VNSELLNNGKNPEKIAAAKQSTSDAASQGKPDPSIFHDLWQATKYSAVQETYDGLSQLANHFGAELAERKLEDRPLAPTSTLDSVAQTIGYGLGKTPGFAAVYFATRFGGTRIAEATAGSLSIAAQRELSIGQLAFAGAAYDGLTTKSSDNNFWADRGKAAIITGGTLYALGRSQIALQGATGLIGKEAAAGLLPSLTQRAGNAGLGLVAGGFAGAINAEGRTEWLEHRHATLTELGKSAGYYGAVSLAMGALLKTPPEVQTIPKGTGLRTGLSVPPAGWKAPYSAEYKVIPRMKLPPLNNDSSEAP